MPFLGTLTNIVTVLAGAALGTLLGARLPERIRSTVMASLGLLTLALGVRESLASPHFVLVLAAVLAGAVVGELLRIEDGLERLGDRLRDRFLAHPEDPVVPVDVPETALPRPHRAGFSEGFVIASLVFCVGPLTVLGSIEDGLGDPELLLVKAGLDGFAAVAFASVYGWGVAAAALTVGVVQGGIAALALVVSGLLTPEMVDGLAAAGGILLLGVGLRLLDLGRIRVANLLPALLFAPVLVRWLG